MKKIYNLGYENGKYYLEYSMPENDEGRLDIDEKTMELDSVRFYKMFFEKATESMEIIISNKIEETNEKQVYKKGERVCETLQLLCDEICKEINKKCFKE
ncbi:MAG: hypothetical protein DBX40_03615 [Clostridiales bacterium]|nr:MAG: hypothetical protein DBX40_03615 [Clostridiales bacterium]